MELVLVRHAQPAWANPDGTSTNSPGLTPLGRKQAERLAEWLASDESPDFDALITSPARRTRETAAAVESVLGAEAEVLPWLLEIGSPDHWEGQPETEVVRIISEMRARPRDEWWDGSPGGERFIDFHRRVTEGLGQFLADQGIERHWGDPDNLWYEKERAHKSLLMFAHAGTNSVVTSYLLGLEPQPWEWERFPCDHASVTVLRTRPIAGGAIWSLDYFSDVAHLPRDAVTS